MLSYLFYDIETTGLNPAFDQMLQFAAIRTDSRLQELDRHTETIRLRPDVIPSPGAFLTHGIDIDTALSGSREFEAVARIHRRLNDPGTVSIGYNSLGFDDEFLRFSFYRNLMPPYTHQYDKGCNRMDLYPMVIIFRLFRPELLAWPEVDGSPSMKLEHLCAANGLGEGPAHDALFDAQTTLALARKMMPDQETWRYLSGYFDKATDLSRMEKMPVEFHTPSGRHRKALMIDGKFGFSLSFQAPVLSIGRSIPYANQTLWLRLDTPELQETTPETIAETTWVIRKKAGEPGLLLPAGGRHWRQLSRERRTAAGDNIAWLRSRPGLFEGIVRYHQEYRYPRIPDLDADAALYHTGFLSPEERQWCRRFHEAPIADRYPMIPRIPTETLRELARRVMFRNYSSSLPKQAEAERSRFMARVNPPQGEKAMVDYRGQERRTPAPTLSEIDRMLREAELGPRRKKTLEALAAYIRGRFTS